MQPLRCSSLRNTCLHCLLFLTLAIAGDARSDTGVDVGPVSLSCGAGKALSPSFEVSYTVGEPVVDRGVSASYQILTGVWALLGAPPRLEPGPRPPEVFFLDQGFPNPASRSMTIRFGVPQQTRVDLTILDATGREVRALVAGVVGPGSYSIAWDGCDERGQPLAPGVYYSRFRSAAFSRSRKLTLLP